LIIAIARAMARGSQVWVNDRHDAIKRQGHQAWWRGSAQWLAARHARIRGGSGTFIKPALG
jgi:hypothetical protein